MPAIPGLPHLPAPKPPAGSLAVEPELFALAHKRGHAPAFRIWTQCRNLDPDGRGWVTQNELLACAPALDLQPRSILRIMAEAPDWFDLAGERIFYTAQIKLLLLYGWEATRYSGTSTIPARALAPLGTFNAFCFGAYYALHTHTTYDGIFITPPLSRALLRKKFGVTVQTLRHWEKISGVTVEPNFSIGTPAESDVPGEIHCTCGHYWYNEHVAQRQEAAGDFSYHGRDRVTPVEHRAVCPGHTFQTVHQRANSYIPPKEVTGRRRPSFKNHYRSAQIKAAKVAPIPVSTEPLTTSAELPPWNCEPNSRQENQAPMGHCLPAPAPEPVPTSTQASAAPRPRYRALRVTDMVPPALLARCLPRQLWYA